MRKGHLSLAALVLLAGGALTAVECSGGPVCGDGVVDGSEQCDHGKANGTPGDSCSATCKLLSVPVAMLQVSYTLLDSESAGFSGSGCSELGIAQAHVVVDGPSPADEMWGCVAMKSSLYSKVMEGAYKATITLLAADGTPLSNAVTTSSANVVIGPQITNLSISFHQSDFIKQDYVGTLYFKPEWGTAGVYCAAASPAVTAEAIRLLGPTHAQVAGMTKDGFTLDGTPGTGCFTPGASLSQEIDNLPWGHYTMSLTGYSGAAGARSVSFCTTRDIFVGPGTTTPIYDIVAPAGSPNDAGPSDGGC